MPEAAATNGASNGAGTPETAASLLQQFHAIADANGGLVDDPGVVIQKDAEPVEPAAIVAPAPAAPAKPSVADAVDPALAPEKTKPGGAPDWAAFREERRQVKAKHDAREAQLAARQAEVEAKAKAAEATSPEKIRAAFESGNFDGVAQAYGFKSWNDMNDQATRAFASPEFKRMQELEARAERLESERAQEKQEREQAIAEQTRQHAEREYIGYVDTSLKSAGDDVVKGLAEDPGFTRAVFSYMSDHFRSTGEELDVEYAAQQLVPGIKAHYQRLHKFFGDQPTAQQAEIAKAITPDRAGSKQPARQTNKVARTRAADAGSPSGELTHAEFIKMGAREMEKSLDQDLREGKF